METSERRKDPREDCFIPVDFTYEDKARTEFIRNISKQGMFIDTKEQIPVGRAFILTYHLPQQGQTKRIGKVVWADSGGMGVRLPDGGVF